MRPVIASLLLAAAPAWTQEPALRIEVTQGEGAIHNVRDRDVVRPAVRVLDERGDPVAGAAVTFRLPDSGPGGTFDKGKLLSLTTDARGEAAVRAFRTNLQIGSWQIRVAAQHDGRTGRAVIAQTNAAPVEAFVTRGRARPLYLIAILAAGAAGATLGISQSRSAAAPRAPSAGPAAVAPGLSITAGSGSIGTP